jgi:hypothetical protein
MSKGMLRQHGRHAWIGEAIYPEISPILRLGSILEHPHLCGVVGFLSPRRANGETKGRPDRAIREN